MERIRTEDAVGHVLCHDLTRIVRGGTKGPAFRKGHIVREEDIPVLLSMGKENLYVWPKGESRLHEDEAAEILRQISQGPGMHATEPSEGRIDLIADKDGLFTVNADGLRAVNSLGEMMIASRHGGFAVRRGDKLAGMRIIPLVIEREKMEDARKAAGSSPLFEILPFRKMRCGVVATGNEVWSGRIKDTFTDVIREKLDEYGLELVRRELCPDDPEVITAAVRNMLEDGMDMVLCTGGMSVDPDDRTPLAIRQAGCRIISYGAPALPGAMFLLSCSEDGRPVVGLPGCVMYSRRTVFDLVLPKLAAGVAVTAEELADLGEGGLCLQCEVCTFPDCSFGK